MSMSTVNNESIYSNFNVKWQMLARSWECTTKRIRNDNIKEKQLINLERYATEVN